MAASMSRSASLRIRVPSTTSPVPRALPARRAHDGAEDRGPFHAGAREEKGLGPMVDPTTGDDRADAGDCVQDPDERGGARLDGGPNRQGSARECEQEGPQPQGTPHAGGPSEDAGKHVAILEAGGICNFCRGPRTTGSHPPKKGLPAVCFAKLLYRLPPVLGGGRV